MKLLINDMNANMVDITSRHRLVFPQFIRLNPNTTLGEVCRAD